jgi:hypothetical protein
MEFHFFRKEISMTHSTRTQKETRDTREQIDQRNPGTNRTRSDSEMGTQNNPESSMERQKVKMDEDADTKPFFITEKDKAQWRHERMKSESRRPFR